MVSATAVVWCGAVLPQHLIAQRLLWSKHVTVGISACRKRVFSFVIFHHIKFIFLNQALLSSIYLPVPYLHSYNPLPLLSMV